MNLQMLSFQDDEILAREIKEQSNYSDPAHLWTVTFGIAQVVLAALSPIDLDGHKRLTVIANARQEMSGDPGYHHVPAFGISYYNLDRATSNALYQFKKYDKEFQNYVAGILLDILIEIDQVYDNKNLIAQRREDILADLRDSGFQKKRLLEKYSKTSRNKKYKAMVYDCVGYGIGNAIRVELVNRSTGEVLLSKWVTEIPCTLFVTGEICKTYWEGDKFYVLLWKTEPHKTVVVEVPSVAVDSSQ